MVQLTTIIVPVLDSFFTRSPPAPSIIIACFLAASGAVLVSIDSSIADAFITIRTTIEHCVGLAPITAVGAGASFAFGKSEMMVILSACFYSMHIIRLGAFANRISSAAALARIKSLTQLLTAIAAITFTVLFNVAERRTLLDYIISVTSAPSLNRDVLLLLSSAVWNGAICTAFTMWAQTFAQRVVSSTRANLVYSTQPVWACIMSVVFLGERLHSAAMVGSVLLLVAVIISGRSSAPFRQ